MSTTNTLRTENFQPSNCFQYFIMHMLHKSWTMGDIIMITVQLQTLVLKAITIEKFLFRCPKTTTFKYLKQGARYSHIRIAWPYFPELFILCIFLSTNTT